MSKYLLLDESGQWALSQLRAGLLCHAERWCHHLPSCAVHIDEMHQARKVLQVCGGGLRVSNNFGALPEQPLSLRETAFNHHNPPPLKPSAVRTHSHLCNPPGDPYSPGWVPSHRDGYDTMVILRLLFTSRKSRQSSSFSLPRRSRVRGWDPPSPSTADCGAAPG